MEEYLIICIKMDSALNNLQRLICHEINQPINPPTDSESSRDENFWTPCIYCEKNFFLNLSQALYMVFNKAILQAKLHLKYSQ